ncbi:MAG: sulfatase [Pricia sp.]
MIRKTLILVLTSLVISLQAGCSESQSDSKPIKPNIILINVDDLGWKDLGFMGSKYYETPNLDALAKQGLVFSNAYAGAANCAPSRACMLSGHNTPWHGVYTVSPSARGNAKTRKLIPIKNTKFLGDSVYTLPRMLKNAGYVTGSFGKWHVGDDPTKQGIDVNVGGDSRGNPGGKGYFSPYTINNIEDGPKGEYLTDRLTQEAIAFVEKYRDSTFFLYLPFYTVHGPIMGKDSLIAKFEDKPGTDGQDRPDYAAMIASMDENVGKLLDKIKASGLEENTFVLFTSDNGGIREVSEQNPLRAGKGSYYEGGIREPLIIKWPGNIEPGSTSDTQVSHLDFYPTLQNIVNPPKKADNLDGLDLAPIFKGEKLAERDLFFHFPIYLQAYSKEHDDGRDPLFRTRPGSVIISGDWKLHEYFEDGGLELYNLKEDIGEEQNVAQEYPEKTKQLHDSLITWRKDTGAPVPLEKNPDYDAAFEDDQM